MLNPDVKIVKFDFGTFIPNAWTLYVMLLNNRERLAPWFWWANEKVTANFCKTLLFGTSYIIEVKRRKISRLLFHKKSYDEQFLIFSGAKLTGMIGLDDIDTAHKEAEIWCFITPESEGKGIASASFKILADYAFDAKGLDCIYARTAAGNDKSEAFLRQNNFQIAKIEYGVPISSRNPKITDLTTWEYSR